MLLEYPRGLSAASGLPDMKFSLHKPCGRLPVLLGPAGQRGPGSHQAGILPRRLVVAGGERDGLAGLVVENVRLAAGEGATVVRAVGITDTAQRTIDNSRDTAQRGQ